MWSIQNEFKKGKSEQKKLPLTKMTEISHSPLATGDIKPTTLFLGCVLASD